MPEATRFSAAATHLKLMQDILVNLVRAAIQQGVSQSQIGAELMAQGIVLDSLSESQEAQGLDGQFWRQELIEESDYLIRICCREDFAERVEPESKQRPSSAAMMFDGNGL